MTTLRTCALFVVMVAGTWGCSVTVKTWQQSSVCGGEAAESRTFTANNTCVFTDGGEYVLATVSDGVLLTTYFERSTCSAELISAEPAKYPHNMCVQLGGGVSAIASWALDSPDCAVTSVREGQAAPCFWSDFTTLPGQSYRDFLCHSVGDDSIIMYESSSDNKDAFGLAVFTDSEFASWVAGNKTSCVNTDCTREDSNPKLGSYTVNSAGSPYHVIFTNPGAAASSATFDMSISVSVGSLVGSAEVGQSVTGIPVPPCPCTLNGLCCMAGCCTPGPCCT